jgi:hypothetical protein
MRAPTNGWRCRIRTPIGVPGGGGVPALQRTSRAWSPLARRPRGVRQGHRAARGVDRLHVPTRPAADAEAAPLADREPVDAVVRADDRTALVDDRAGPERVGAHARCDERGGVAARDEADLHAVGLVRDREAEPPRLGAHLVLRELADGEQRALELRRARA